MNTLELRKFGFLMGTIFTLVFGTLLPFMLKKALPLFPWVIGSIFLLLAFIRPLWLNKIYIYWMKIGHILGWINTRIILGVIFFGLITPLGLILRLCKRDPLKKHYQTTLHSYRKNIVPPSINHMEKPF